MDEKINLKFRKVMTSQGWLKKSEYYTFGFTKKQFEEGKKRDYRNPLLIYEDGSILALYFEKDKLKVKYFTSYYGFDEGLGKHGLNKKWENGASCLCGKFFYDKKRKKGIDYLNEHTEHMEKLQNE